MLKGFFHPPTASSLHATHKRATEEIDRAAIAGACFGSADYLLVISTSPFVRFAEKSPDCLLQGNHSKQRRSSNDSHG